jgi:hypothetical protein
MRKRIKREKKEINNSLLLKIPVEPVMIWYAASLFPLSFLKQTEITTLANDHISSYVPFHQFIRLLSPFLLSLSFFFFPSFFLLFFCPSSCSFYFFFLLFLYLLTLPLGLVKQLPGVPLQYFKMWLELVLSVYTNIPNRTSELLAILLYPILHSILFMPPEHDSLFRELVVLREPTHSYNKEW